MTQERVRHNDYSTLDPPPLGRWTPRLSVSVVIPAWRCEDTLGLVLAGLAAQTYPAHLLEVVVVDDGNDPPIRLPEIRPERTRLVRSDPSGWGRAHACHTGASNADGEVIHWLDADMLPYAEHVEAQLRWHHLADYLVVLGYKRFVDYQPGAIPPEQAYKAVRAGRAEHLFDLPSSSPHEWVERIIGQTSGLRRAAYEAFRVHVGATASLHRRLYDDAGGFDTTLVLGEDYEFGYRLSQAGAVFIPEPAAGSWHLGAPSVVTVGERVRRYNQPFIVNRVPQPRWRRPAGGRQWLVPYVDIVVDASSGPYEQVAATCDRALSGSVSDVRLTLVGPWRRLDGGRRSPLDDPLQDLRLLREHLGSDGRVCLAEEVAATSAPAAFRLLLPTGWILQFQTLRDLTALAEQHEYGLVVLAGPGGEVARLERTAAFSRALAVQKSGESLDEAVAAVSATCELAPSAVQFSFAGRNGQPLPARRATRAERLKALRQTERVLVARLWWVRHTQLNARWPRLARLLRRLARRPEAR